MTHECGGCGCPTDHEDHSGATPQRSEEAGSIAPNAAPHVAPVLPAAVQQVIDSVTAQRRRDLVEIEKRMWGIFP